MSNVLARASTILSIRFIVIDEACRALPCLRAALPARLPPVCIPTCPMRRAAPARRAAMSLYNNVM